MRMWDGLVLIEVSVKAVQIQVTATIIISQNEFAPDSEMSSPTYHSRMIIRGVHKNKITKKKTHPGLETPAAAATNADFSGLEQKKKKERVCRGSSAQDESPVAPSKEHQLGGLEKNNLYSLAVFLFLLRSYSHLPPMATTRTRRAMMIL